MRTCFDMKTIIIVFIVFLSLTGDIFSQTFESQKVEGAIEEILGDRVYVKGLQGSHIFEMISACSWCERGAPVSIIFESLSRAIMLPYPNPLQIAPVRLFVIRDGREDNL